MQCKSKLKILIQYLVPQHALSGFAGCLANCRWRWWKNWLIKDFIKRYKVDLSMARLEKIADYSCFNSFFTRQLKPELRPIVQGANQIAAPADGCISQLGHIQKDRLFQAKGFNFPLNALVGGSDNLTKIFYDGNFATIYLAPKDYHRVHMPLAGQLRKTIYIPGKLFSVNPQTTNAIPELFSRNERLVCIFDTAVGPMAIILVGALLVSSIQTVWPLEYNSKKITKKFYANMVRLDRGAELGLFKMGSTVIVLFPKNVMEWSSSLQENSLLQMGQLMGVTN